MRAGFGRVRCRISAIGKSVLWFGLIMGLGMLLALFANGRTDRRRRRHMKQVIRAHRARTKRASTRGI